MTVKTFGFIGASALTALLAAGCGGSAVLGSNHGTATLGSNPSTVAVIFFDISKSTRGARKGYASAFATIVCGGKQSPTAPCAASLPGGTLLEIGEIASDPLADATGLKSEYFERRGDSLRSQNALTEQKQHSDAASDAVKYVARLLPRRVEGDSILDSLNVAQRVFHSFPDAQEKYLVIFSDMIETSKRYRFSRTTLKPASVAAFIKSERKSSLLPDLRGVKVYAIGADVTKGKDTGLAHLIESFWSRYLKAAHANISSYSGGLIRFP